MSHEEFLIMDGDAAKQGDHYLRLMQELMEKGVVQLGRLNEAVILHDDWCPMLEDPTSSCTCNVIARFNDGKEFSYAELVKTS